MANMQVFDIMILILVGWLTLRGAMKGMVSQLASIAAVIASFWAAVRFGPVLQPFMQSAFNAQYPWDKVLAITVAFVGASIAVMFLKSIVMKIISAIHMNKFDRLCGALFGFLKGVLVGMIITFFAVMLSEQTRELATQSHSGKILVRLIQHTQTLMPEDVSTLIETNLEGFRQQISSNSETAEGAIAQANKASDTLSNGRNMLQTMQDGLTSLSQQFAGMADTQPRISTDDSVIRKYPWPSELDQLTSVTTTASSAASGSQANLQTTFVDSISFSTSTSQPVLTIPASSPVPASVPIAPQGGLVSPSADLQPMTSTSTPPLPASTDWRVLFREMK